jgi:hypothetical protein
MGDIILLGDFNARTKNEQTTLFDTSKASYNEISTEEAGLQRQALDMGEVMGVWQTFSGTS